MRHAYRLTHGHASLSILGDQKYLPSARCGRGGEPGSRQTVYINRGTPRSSDIGMLAADEAVDVDDVVEICPAEAAAYGDPLTRDPASSRGTSGGAWSRLERPETSTV